MEPLTLEDLVRHPGVARLTVEQYERMIEQAILPEGAPVELIDGLLVRKDRSARGSDLMTIGPGHQTAVTNLIRLAAGIEALGGFLLIQGAIRLPPSHEPEPDAAVIRGTVRDFAERHPGPADVAAVIEVSDSSLERDRTTKLRIYAAAAVPLYVIVNLVERQVELRTAPSPTTGQYAQIEIRREGQSFDLPVGAGEFLRDIPVADVLP